VPGSTAHVRAVMKKLARAIEDLEEPAVEKIATEEQENPFHVLISTMLSAQTRDEVTYAASSRLFRRARSPKTMAALSTKEIEKLIYPVSFYRNKAVYVKDTCAGAIRRQGARHDGGDADAARRGPEDGEPGADSRARQPREHLRRHACASDLEPARMGAHEDAGADGTGALPGHAEEMVAERQPVSGDVGPERLPADVSALPGLRAGRHLSEDRRHEGGTIMTRLVLRFTSSALLALLALSALVPAHAQAPAPAPGNPVVVFDTVKGSIEIELFAKEAPKSAAQIVRLVRENFYRGLRFHRAEATLVQTGDPNSKSFTREALWGTGGSGRRIGTAEIVKTRKHVRGAVGLAHAGNPANADSQFYIMRKASPSLDGKHAVIGRVVAGLDIVDKLQRGDMIRRAFVKGEAPLP
jgi:cyclophilin family peptidyl-prolyl cis-trans isomerase